MTTMTSISQTVSIHEPAFVTIADVITEEDVLNAKATIDRIRHQTALVSCHASEISRKADTGKRSFLLQGNVKYFENFNDKFDTLNSLIKDAHNYFDTILKQFISNRAYLFECERRPDTIDPLIPLKKKMVETCLNLMENFVVSTAGFMKMLKMELNTFMRKATPCHD